jgi:hypothetical protein
MDAWLPQVRQAMQLLSEMMTEGRTGLLVELDNPEHDQVIEISIELPPAPDEPAADKPEPPNPTEDESKG